MGCSNTLFAKRDFAAELAASPPAFVRAYATLVSFRTGIQEQMTRLQRLIEDGPDPARLVEAVKVKRRIVESLARVDAIAKAMVVGGGGGGGTGAGVGGMSGVEGTGGAAADGAEARIRNNIALATANWGREVGLRLKTLTTALDGAVSAARPSAREEVLARLGKTLPPAQPNGHAPVQGVVGEDEKRHERDKDGERKKRKDEEEDEDEKGDSAIRETIVVLEEQKFLLLQMLQDAKRRRRFDEVDALNRSLEEIEHEVDSLGGGVVGV